MSLITNSHVYIVRAVLLSSVCGVIFLFYNVTAVRSQGRTLASRTGCASLPGSWVPTEAFLVHFPPHGGTIEPVSCHGQERPAVKALALPAGGMKGWEKMEVYCWWHPPCSPHIRSGVAKSDLHKNPCWQKWSGAHWGTPAGRAPCLTWEHQQPRLTRHSPHVGPSQSAFTT